jgi:hypothetical protein
LDRAAAAGAAALVDAAAVLIMLSILKEFAVFVRTRRKYWLTPILIMLVIFGALVVLTQGSAVAPFIYTLF